MRKSRASLCSRSTSTFASSTWPPRAATARSSNGPSCRQGPHHSAQKSTTTGTACERSITSFWKLASVTSMHLMVAVGKRSSASSRRARSQPCRPRVAGERDPSRASPRWPVSAIPAAPAPGGRRAPIPSPQPTRPGGKTTCMAERLIGRGVVRLAVEVQGEGLPVVLLHGLTATRRYVVMGSRLLERSGHRVITYDARGHGRSSPAERPDAYEYRDLVGDLEAVMDALGVERAVLAGASMGAHTALALALRAPQRVAALVVITPAYAPDEHDDPARLARWDALAEGLRQGGVEGFVRAYGEPRTAPAYRETVLKVIRQRLALHEHPEAVADALRVVPRSRPFGALEELRAIEMPTLVVASNDAADPGHPQALGERYAQLIPGARLILDQPGHSPIAWQGSQLSRLIAEVAGRASL